MSRSATPLSGLTNAPSWILEHVLPADRGGTDGDGARWAPAHPWHSLDVNRVPSAALGVSKFGQAGGLDDVYRYHGIDTDSIVRAASTRPHSAHIRDVRSIALTGKTGNSQPLLSP